ncbi:MAG TPA: phytase, partial [Nocardioides sp.]|nr:phytase [Nocardioides sp.]
MRRSVVALLMLLAFVAPANAVDDPIVPAPSVRETTPVESDGDAMDDPAVWVHPTDPAKSLVIGNNKQGALETYDLEGDRVQQLSDTVTFWGNVDVRQDVLIDGVVGDVVAVYHRGLQLYRVNPSTRLLTRVNEGTAIPTPGEGLCLYSSAETGRLYAFVIAISGALRQFEIRDDDQDGLLEGVEVRQFAVGSEAEGCVADDERGAVYVSEEEVGLWRYGAEPEAGTARTSVDTVDGSGHLALDVEGVTLVDLPDGGGYIIASAQNAADPNSSFFVVYDRITNAYLRSVRVTAGGSSDDCDRTDGITAIPTDLGPPFERGIFVCQDNNNDAPGTVGNQNLKYVPLESVVDLDDPTPSEEITSVSASVVNSNTTDWSLPVPAQVEPGDGMLLFLSRSADAAALTGPGAGWTQIGSLVDGSLRTTIWQRVATADDAGSIVQVAGGAEPSKGALALAVYRGTSTIVPFATAAGAVTTGTTDQHTTPLVSAPAGALRVSYWADRSSSEAGWTAPSGEIVRVLSAGTGGGRIGVLLTDPGEPVGGGSTGGLTAVAASPSHKA